MTTAYAYGGIVQSIALGNLLPSVELYAGDTWQFNVVASDGTSGLGAIPIQNGGENYTTAPTVSFGAPPVGGRIAAGTATIAGGAVTGVVLSDPGIYAPGLAPSVTFLGGGGSGAEATAVVGNPTNLAGSTPGASIILSPTGQPIDISSSIVVTSAAMGAFSIIVADSITPEATVYNPPSSVFETRIRIWITDANGAKHTLGVQPVQAIAA